jgi:hypothetical protein
MLVGRTAKAIGIQPADWIWSNWLKEQDRSDLKYHRFTHYEFLEDATQRDEVKYALAKLLYDYHTSSPVNTNLLSQLRYRQLASVLIRDKDQRPRDHATHSGNLVEILACEFATKQGYDIPILRLQYNPNPDQSMKGDDILGFWFSENRTEQDALLVGEGKFRNRFEKKVVEEAFEGLKRKNRLYPVSMEFVATILDLEGSRLLAAQIRQLRQRLASQDKQVVREHLLFLGTVGPPQNPFEFLEEYEENLLPNLIAVNIVFQNDFRNWLAEVYEEEVRV